MKVSTNAETSAQSGVQVIIEDLDSHPVCPHGPTLLFSRKGQENRQFFACSACRDRKLCNFFLWADDKGLKGKMGKSKLEVWDSERKKMLSGINHRKQFILLNKVKTVSPNNRTYCQTCNTFTQDNSQKHLDHSLLSNLTDYQLEHPSEILHPLENAKKEAQYLFSKESVEFIVNTFVNLGYKNVICVGTPRIHEHIVSSEKNLCSILLDLDKRFHSFFGPLEYCWYNSFNNHFFLEEAKDVFDEFLKCTGGENTVLVTDPPFGGRIEPLAHTFSIISQKFTKLNKKELPLFWIFPYFMEAQLKLSLPKYNMLDYKVQYDNHPLFQHGPKGRKQGSPVRIFTNVDPSLIKLPSDLYKFCKRCNKWVAKENKHCKLCQACTSKNGETYSHCKICQRCVKPNWRHCVECNRCAQVDHKCGDLTFSGVCLKCKQSGHKKTDCPEVTGKRRKKQFMLKNKKFK